MKEDKYPAINVIAAIRSFATGKLKYKVTPYRFQLTDGRVHAIKTIRRMTTQDVGGFRQFHYVVQSNENRYFHIVFDSASLTWKLIQEVDEELFFSD